MVQQHILFYDRLFKFLLQDEPSFVLGYIMHYSHMKGLYLACAVFVLLKAIYGLGMLL